MIDLKKESGLPIGLEDSLLILGNGVLAEETSARTLEELRPLLADPRADFRKAEIYHMYRTAGFSKDIDAFRKNHLRYDITVLEKGRVGDEFVKTVGHYHPFKAGTQTRYPEIYEVIHGHALFVMQKIGNSVKSVDAVYLVLAEAGEKAVMLPGTGHVTVNLGNTPLVMANFVSDDFTSVYEPYRERRGAVYYILSRNDGIHILQNGAYDPIPRPRVLKPREVFLGLSLGGPLYAAASEDLERFRWLNFPEEHEGELNVESLFCNAQLSLQRRGISV